MIRWWIRPGVTPLDGAVKCGEDKLDGNTCHSVFEYSLHFLFPLGLGYKYYGVVSPFSDSK